MMMIPRNSTITKKPDLLSALQLRLIALQLKVENGLLGLFTSLLYQKNAAPKSVLIFRTGSLGDSICSIPTIMCIREQYPAAQIDILTNCGASHLVGLKQLLPTGQFQEVIDYSGYGKTALLKLLRTRKYDMVIQLPQVDAGFIPLFRDLIVFRTVASAGWGWVKSQTRFFRKTQARHLTYINETERLLQLAGTHSVATGPYRPFLESTPADVQAADQFLAEAGVDPALPLIAIVTGSKRPQNRWPIHYFKELVEYFGKSYQLVFIGAAEEEKLITGLLHLPNTFNACGKLSPLGSAALIKRCVLSISNDTGPMHLSYAVGTPTIALFSSRDLPGKWFPPSHPSHRVFRAEGIACEGCFSETCADNICMQAIKPAEVIEAATLLLNPAHY